MSLTEHLLLNKPIRLPEGTIRRIGFDMASPREAVLEQTRRQVLQSIELGFNTLQALHSDTGLSIETIKLRVHDLEDLGRVTWTTGKDYRKVFEVVR